MTSTSSSAIQSTIRRLLRRNISFAQIAGYAAANMVGLAIVVTALMFYIDATTAKGGTREADPYLSPSFEVVSKKVEGIGLTPTAFTPGEIAELRNQPWALRVGEFTPSRFTVSALIELGGRGMSSYLFMESIPDEFFDVRPRDWNFDPSRPFIPVIINKEYLALYNFGFAAPQGLPQLSEAVVTSVPITFALSGPDGRREVIPGGIAGFSSRLNTVAVPQSFMDWANERFAPGEPPLPPSRLIVECDQRMRTQMDSYLRERGIETTSGTDDAGVGRIARFSAIAGWVVSGVGAVISLLAVAILFLSIYLILQKSRSRLSRLMLLGYSPRQVGRPLEALVAIVNGLVAVVAIALMFAARSLWRPMLADLDLGGASPMIPILTAIAVMAIITLANIITIRRHLQSIMSE